MKKVLGGGLDVCPHNHDHERVIAKSDRDRDAGDSNAREPSNDKRRGRYDHTRVAHADKADSLAALNEGGRFRD